MCCYIYYIYLFGIFKHYWGAVTSSSEKQSFEHLLIHVLLHILHISVGIFKSIGERLHQVANFNATCEFHWFCLFMISHSGTNCRVIAICDFFNKETVKETIEIIIAIFNVTAPLRLSYSRFFIICMRIHSYRKKNNIKSSQCLEIL